MMFKELRRRKKDLWFRPNTCSLCQAGLWQSGMRLMKEQTFDRFFFAFGMMDGHSRTFVGLTASFLLWQEMTLAALRCDTIVFAAVINACEKSCSWSPALAILETLDSWKGWKSWKGVCCCRIFNCQVNDSFNGGVFVKGWLMVAVFLLAGAWWGAIWSWGYLTSPP